MGATMDDMEAIGLSGLGERYALKRVNSCYDFNEDERS